jgi:hypothetical protein
VALMWETWHFTSHLKGTLHEVMSRLSIYIPLVVAVTFLLGFVVERTDSLLLAVTLHAWLDIGVDKWNLSYVGRAGVHSALGLAHLDVARSSRPPLLLETYVIDRIHSPTLTGEERQLKQIVFTRVCRGSVRSAKDCERMVGNSDKGMGPLARSVPASRLVTADSR